MTVRPCSRLSVVGVLAAFPIVCVLAACSPPASQDAGADGAFDGFSPGPDAEAGTPDARDAAADTQPDVAPDAPEPTGCPSPLTRRPTLADLQPVFTRSCAGTSGCHSTADTRGDLLLTDGTTLAQTVGVASVQLTDWMRIVPGNALRSYLFRKVAWRDRSTTYQVIPDCMGTGNTCGAPMPGLNLPPVSDDEIAQMRDWICAGAPAN